MMRRYLIPFVKQTYGSRSPIAVFLTPVMVGLVAVLGFLYIGPLRFSRPAAAAPPVENAPAADLFAPAETRLLAPPPITPQTVITPQDIVVVFDVSGSMENETTCYDCWVRTDPDNPDYPNNGYFNPLPFNPDWSTSNNSIPHSDLCQAAPQAEFDGDGTKYLSHEAELYSRNFGDWRFAARRPGQGFWVIQRGTRADQDAYNPYDDDSTEADYPYFQGNQAGYPYEQSSNVCDPGIAGTGINCTIGGDNICDLSDGTTAATAADTNNPKTGVDNGVDCSAYIKAHPFPTYGSSNAPKLQGSAYNIDCLTTAACWSVANPLPPNRGAPPNKDLIPFVEYDFTPDWDGQAHIWLRAIGGGDRAYVWNGSIKVTDDPPPWRDAILWEVYKNGALEAGPTEDRHATEVSGGSAWRDNRARNNQWKWIKLAAPNVAAGTPYTLRLYQGSAGYKIDKIVFTDDATSPDDLRDANGQKYGSKGPPATNGSATREACNICNPAYGLTVAPGDCGCPVNEAEAQTYINVYDDPNNVVDTPAEYGSGDACTQVSQPTNMLENDLYSGVQPLRSVQETVKDIILNLDTKCHQVGVVAFSTEVKEEADKRSTTLWCQEQADDPSQCEDAGTETGFSPVLETVERQWPENYTNISAGLKQGLIELGVVPFADPLGTTCGDGQAQSTCARTGARKILILMTDGAPTKNAGSYCRPNGTDPDTGEKIKAKFALWQGDAGENDNNYYCAMHYAQEAAKGGVIVYTIGVGPGVDADLLTAMATGINPNVGPNDDDIQFFSARGGKFFEAATPADLARIIAEIPTACSSSVIERVTLTGPTGGLVDVSYPFTAMVEPPIAPVTYTWQATGQTPLTRTDGVSDTVSFAWDAPGDKVITVTARGPRGVVVSATHSIFIAPAPVPPTSVTLEGPPAGTVQTDQAFIAAVDPPTATWPFTYVWQAIGQSPLTRTGGLSDSVSFAWDTPGSKTITVSAANPAAAPPVMAMHTIDIVASTDCDLPFCEAVYLPLILKEEAEK